MNLENLVSDNFGIQLNEGEVDGLFEAAETRYSAHSDFVEDMSRKRNTLFYHREKEFDLLPLDLYNNLLRISMEPVEYNLAESSEYVLNEGRYWDIEDNFQKFLFSKVQPEEFSELTNMKPATLDKYRYQTDSRVDPSAYQAVFEKVKDKLEAPKIGPEVIHKIPESKVNKDLDSSATQMILEEDRIYDFSDLDSIKNIEIDKANLGTLAGYHNSEVFNII